MKDYSEDIVLDAISDSGGIISTIANKLGCDWHTAKTYVNKFESTKQAYDSEEESVLDIAESKLIENIQDNDNTSIIFYLKTKGKKRGYIERTELEHSGKITNTIPVFVFKELNPKSE